MLRTKSLKMDFRFGLKEYVIDLRSLVLARYSQSLNILFNSLELQMNIISSKIVRITLQQMKMHWVYSKNSSASFEMNTKFETISKLNTDKPSRIFALSGCSCISGSRSMPIKLKLFRIVRKAFILGEFDWDSSGMGFSIVLLLRLFILRNQLILSPCECELIFPFLVPFDNMLMKTTFVFQNYWFSLSYLYVFVYENGCVESIFGLKWIIKAIRKKIRRKQTLHQKISFDLTTQWMDK